MNTGSRGSALITGASSVIGVVYGDRLARRGHDLILVARKRDRLGVSAGRLSRDTGRSVRVMVADLNAPADLGPIHAVAPAILRRTTELIINIASVVGI